VVSTKVGMRWRGDLGSALIVSIDHCNLQPFVTVEADVGESGLVGVIVPSSIGWRA
jgi:hypothetical protein